jgi:predicted kinase
MAWALEAQRGRTMTQGVTPPRLVLLCGLPASGKTTLARELVGDYRAVRFDIDEWMRAAGIDPFDEDVRAALEARFWALTQRLLALGTSVVLEWGFWVRSERLEKLEVGRAVGAAVELWFLDVPYEELRRRVADRRAVGGIAITERHMEQYRRVFEPPTEEELGRFDPPLVPDAS